MGKAQLTIGPNGKRIELRTLGYGYGEFEWVLSRCKKVGGGRFSKADPDDKFWHYPLSIETCLSLREVWGAELKIGNDLAAWYVEEAKRAALQADLGAANDATLHHVPAAFADWLRGYQRAGALWIARGYRNAGIIGDTPGLGKTTEVLAGLVEAQISGPVLVVCPKASVRGVWGKEMREHLPDVPAYLCYGTRERRQRVLSEFSNDLDNERRGKVPPRLRIVVAVAEMLRVELGDPCYTQSGNKIPGFCPQRRQSVDGECHLHRQWREHFSARMEPREREKNQVPVGFSFSQLFDGVLLGGGWRAVVLDESHKLLGSLTISKANLMGRGLRLLPYAEGCRRYPVSGTPFGKGGRAQGMFGTLHWCWPDEFPGFWRWAEETHIVEDKVVNRRGKTVKNIVGLKGVRRDATVEEQLEALEKFMRNLGPRILRRTKEECLAELPPKHYVDVLCELTPRQRKQLTQLAEYAEVHTTNGVITPLGSLALLTRSRQIANGAIDMRNDESRKVFFVTGHSGKIDALIDKLEERGIIDDQPGLKLLVASEFNEFLDTVSWELNRLKVKHLRLDGSTSEAKRQKLMAQWQDFNDPVRVMLLNRKAGGVSITLDAADEVHVLDEDPDPGVNEQLEDRIHRASRNHQVTIYYYRTEGTIDYKKAHDAEYRRQVQHLLLDGRRGKEYVQKFLGEALSESYEE